MLSVPIAPTAPSQPVFWRRARTTEVHTTMKNLTDARQIRIGTRGSALALAQAHEVRDRLTAIYGDKLSFEIVIIKTTGDKILDRALAAVGGKGLFTKELEEALLDESVDIAVHSMKDVQAVLPPGLEISCVLKREDVRDAFISPVAKSLAELPEGSIVGTASIRRESFIRHKRPDLKTKLFRGNVQTRLRKLEEGEAHATLLASAGLRRLGLADRITQLIPVEDMLPAPAQGAIGIELRSGDADTKAIISAINDRDSFIAVEAERAFLSQLDGSCRTPIAALARVDGDSITFKGIILTPGGERIYETDRKGNVKDAAALGKDAAHELYDRGGKDVFRDVA